MTLLAIIAEEVSSLRVTGPYDLLTIVVLIFTAYVLKTHLPRWKDL